MKARKSTKHYLGISLLVVVLLVTAFIVLLPMGIQLTAQSWLRDKGLDANIHFVGFNLNSGVFLVENAEGHSADGKGFSLGKAILEVNWLPLFEKQLDIQRFKVENLYFDILTTDKGLSIAGMDFSKKSQQQDKASAADKKHTSWSAQVQHVELTNIKVCHDNPGVAESKTLTVEQMMKACATLESMKWQGTIALTAPAKNQPMTAGVIVSGGLIVNELLYASADEKQRFVHLGNLAVENFQATGLEQFKTDLIELAMTIQSVFLSGLNANAEISKAGVTGLPVFSTGKQQDTNPVKGKTNKSLSFTINKIVVNGSSKASFVDKTVEPDFKESLSDIKLSLVDINSANPEVKSTLSASIKVSEYGQVNIEGTVQPFADKITVDLKQDIKHIDMANYNVYGKTFIGHKIHSGQMDIKQKIKIKDGYLDTESTVTLNKLKVESLQGEEAKKYKSDLGIPLSTALSLLRDKNNNIKLTIPVTGDMHAPDFSLNDVVSTVTSKAIKEAIINYYTPFGLVKLLGGVVDLATGLSFDPVVFVAGKSDLDKQGVDYLNSLSKLLSERPHLQLTFCGHPARSDILSRYNPEDVGLNNGDEKKPLKLTDKQTGELLVLLKTRMDNMKKYMVKELKVNPGQVLLCSEPDNKQWVTGIDAEPEIAITI